MNRFRVENICSIADWGNPKPPPSLTIVNINYCTTWVLGIRNDQLSSTNDKENQKLYLGYYEVTCLNLAEIGQGLDGFNEH